MEELTISVKIAERPYRLTITKEEEEFVRKAAKQINDRMKDFSDHYAYKDKQDLLAMVSLLFGTKALKYEALEEKEKSRFSERLAEIDKLLSKAL
ncbi:MAG: cell division protein ZapA [Bacteroidales bacterium]|nr:cell division protein ZapA [Bacteroidales bacterium]MCF8386337.1 cell division protein ZapA [Bacteroidales bacterium]MCF8396821.1 cell division protein ZapA [Bacteroidales bacterium]